MSKLKKTVGVREIRARMSAYLRAVAHGESITIADRRKKPIARLVPVEVTPGHEALRGLASLGAVTLGVGKPGRRTPMRLRRKGRLVSEMVIEDRR
jgi:prevent-host-death family protein